MDTAITRRILPCVEKEYAPIWAILWRRRQGWKVNGLISFTRVPRKLCDPSVPDLTGAVVIGVNEGICSYNFGGWDFLGYRVRLLNGQRCWFVFTLLRAMDWVTINGKLLEANYARRDYEKLKAQNFEVIHINEIIGATLASVHCSDVGVSIQFTQNDSEYVLELYHDGHRTLPWEHTGEPRRLLPHEKVTDAIIFTRRARLVPTR